ncbi:Eco57I restriction-modification methylase domain-containing protein [Runella sp.]|uniref:Eco57I restriction-modification methylase domain-containing protein n=1 Tax=Runella sp. TaxID=1960881 RepID=UPI00261C182E|nr:DNA methyltransferase [Runella sp.]
MKQKIKSLIAYFIGSLNLIEKKIPMQDLSIFFSVLIATFTLKKKQSKTSNAKITFADYHSEFKIEIQLVKQRFPDLIKIFLATESQLEAELLFSVFEKLKVAFEKIDDDVDDIISWSYQFLKKDLEKAAFKKIGKDSAKIEDSDLLFTTQFFTDKYMVKYLVNESLSGFDITDIPKIVVIDSASGGGNFLTYSFECLYEHYKEFNPNWSNQKIVNTILNSSIVGYDLDANLSKIASLSLFVKACDYAVPSKSTPIKIFGGTANDILGFLNPQVTSNSISGTTFKTQLQKLNNEKKIKVFVTNPPFMGKRDMDTSLKKYLLANYPESKGDLCVSFIQRIIQLMNEKDVLGVVSQNNWMYLSSLKDFRQLFLAKQTLKECIDLGSNAFEDINGEKTNVALCVIGNSEIKTTRFYNLKFKNIVEKKSLVSNKNISTELTFELNQNQFLKNSNLEFNYQLEHRFENIQGLQLYSEFANPMQGTSTGNNTEFVKFAWEVNGSADWKLVSKGGGFSKWAGLNYYKVHWGQNAEIIKANKGSALRNIDKIPTTQLVYSDTGTLGLNVRVLKENQVFIASGPGIQVLKGNKYAHLAFLNSKVATFLLKLINPKFTISAGYISKIPVAQNILDSKFIAEKSKQCLELKEKYLQKKLPNFEFQHLNYSEIKNLDLFLEKLVIEDIESDYQRLFLESIIEREIRKQYNFNSKELQEVKSVVGESPFFNKKKTLKINSEQLDLLLSGSIDLNCLSTSRAINGYSVGSESVFEDLSYKLDVNPKPLFDFIKKNVSQFKSTKAKYFNDLLHKIILNELGVKQISIYKFQVFDLPKLIESIKSKYIFLNEQRDLTEQIISIIQVHHKSSFFNKPLVSYTKEFLTVGQIHNG